MFHNASGKFETERIVPDDTNVTFGGIEVLAYHSFSCKTTKPIPTPENLEDGAGFVFFNKHSTDTRRRASAVTMHDGEQVTATENGKPARPRKKIPLLTEKNVGF